MAPTGEPPCSNVQRTVSVTRRSYQVVIAATREMGLGLDLKLPWDLPTDFQFFQDVTTKTSDPQKRNATIMGRKTWESTPPEICPLPGRLNVVLTKANSLNISNDDNVLVCSSMESALEILAAEPYSMSIERVFVLGGGDLLRDYMNAPSCDAIHLTEIDISVPCDSFAPRVDTCLYRPWYSSSPTMENGTRYSFNTYVRRKDPVVGGVGTEEYWFLPKMVFERHEEFGYLNLVQNIISNGDMSDNGTTLSKFGCQMRFNLRKTFPLLTTKKVLWEGVVEEILEFIKEKGTDHILESNEAKEYLDSQELNKLSHVINKIKNNPTMFPACNPFYLNLSVSPCQTLAQFYVADSELSCQIYQSSAEASLEIPFSIVAYSLLTCIIAHFCDLVAGDFIHVIGEAYVNKADVETIQKQLHISPKPFPILKIHPEKTKIESFEASDLEVLQI